MTRMRKAMALRTEERVRCLGWTFEVGSTDVELEGHRELQGLN